VPTRKFSADWLNEHRIAPGRGSKLVVHWEHLEDLRWSSAWEVVFRHEGQFWKVTYEEPSTEMQEGLDPWGDEKEVEAVQVEPRMVPAILWSTSGESASDHPSSTALNAAMKAVFDENAKLRKDIDDLHYGLGQAAREAFAQRKKHKAEMLRLHPKVVEKALMHLISRLDYDLHIQVEGGEDAGENQYPKTAERFLKDLAFIAKESYSLKKKGT
jgi:molecular chaperone GrpE (heat shock protein)